MKGERTISCVPFRYGGIMHDFEADAEKWATYGKSFEKCFCCGRTMRNIYSKSGTLLKKTYPYCATFSITKGRNKGKAWFRILCRSCAYDYGMGVIEKDGKIYKDRYEFKE